MKPAVSFYSAFVASHSCTVKAICSFFIFVFSITSASAQDSGFIKKESQVVESNTFSHIQDSISKSNIYPYNKKRVKIIAAANIIGYSAAMTGLYATWYKDYPQSKFHTFNDLPEWKQMDKLGHLYSAYVESRESMELWRWSGISRKKRIWLGGMSGALYQTVIETLDGFSAQWGWSWSDFTANMMGSALLVSQELAWNEQRIQLKWSFHRKHYSDPSLNKRSNELFGKSNPERFLKDYNGQTYWLSTTLSSFIPSANIPPWLQISIGTGAEGMFGGRENIGQDKYGNIIFNRTDIRRYRQWYLAPDIDLSKIRTNKKGLRFALNLLNIIKFPSPSLELSNGKLKWDWLQF